MPKMQYFHSQSGDSHIAYLIVPLKNIIELKPLQNEKFKRHFSQSDYLA